MIDPEVARLRQLRKYALRARAVARALGSTRWALNEPLLARSGCSSWRIARTVSGRLKANPYQRYQQDVGIASLARSSVLAWLSALMVRSRLQALRECESQLRRLSRLLDDARALTWSPDLSDAFGRSQLEIRSLMASLAHETHSTWGAESRTAGQPLARPMAGDWPYLAF
ncbi:MAG: hypothetical protein ACLPSY_11380 [Steroidobacteraceae bacterium]